MYRAPDAFPQVIIVARVQRARQRRARADARRAPARGVSRRVCDEARNARVCAPSAPRADRRERASRGCKPSGHDGRSYKHTNVRVGCFGENMMGFFE